MSSFRPISRGSRLDAFADPAAESPAEETEESSARDGTDGEYRQPETRVPESFPRPPVEFVDSEDRRIEIVDHDGDVAPLEAMYETFDSRERSQGIPPADDRTRREWLDCLVSDGINVVAKHGDAVVGHATLLPMGDGGHELAIFVAPSYQCAGIGTKLIRALFGRGVSRGVERVWLTVERTNYVAINLYTSVGFDTLARGSNVEMELVL